FLDLTGSVDQQGVNNQFNLNAQVSNVNISKFFYSFDNFGIDGLSYKNLRGNFFSKINASGAITDAGKLVSRSMKGVVTFDLKNGALVNYPPFVSVSKFALRGRGLDNVTFSNLNGRFDIDREKINISPMKISSSAINMDVTGVYSLGKGTNISIDVPLRNPKKDAKITDEQERKERRMKGLVLHLVAKDGDDGKIHFGLK
ncbi:MAG: AsmA family protein, partial [Mucilaginibacter polytrichastri]|nr:AsmA family protein [Mucilaginibacter polytrichastri]